MTSSTAALRLVSPLELFNLPLYEHHLVIDTRSLDEYKGGHIASAVSYPSCPEEFSEEEREKSLIEFIQSYVSEYYRPENPSPIVIYGNSQPESILHAEWLAKKLDKLKTDRKMVDVVTPPSSKPIISSEKKFNPFEHFCLTIADHAKEIWFLEGGYNAFQLEYGFLCGQIEFDEMFPLPHQINQFLFLGSRVIPLTRECLGKLGITHMIVSEYQTLDWSQLDRISVLRCSVQETNSQDMISCWEACMQFIAEATNNEDLLHSTRPPSITDEPSSSTATSSSDESKIGNFGNSPKPLPQSSTDDQHIQTLLVQSQKPSKSHSVSDTFLAENLTTSSPRSPRILVILFGRSRSTSVILAYLIRMEGMSFDQAWAFIRTRCWHLIDRSLVYEEQLRTKWQSAR